MLKWQVMITQLNSTQTLGCQNLTHTQPKLHLYATQDTLFQDRNRDAIHTPISSKYEDVPCLPFIFHFILDFQKTYQIFKIWYQQRYNSLHEFKYPRMNINYFTNRKYEYVKLRVPVLSSSSSFASSAILHIKILANRLRATWLRRGVNCLSRRPPENNEILLSLKTRDSRNEIKIH